MLLAQRMSSQLMLLATCPERSTQLADTPNRIRHHPPWSLGWDQGRHGGGALSQLLGFALSLYQTSRSILAVATLCWQLRRRHLTNRSSGTLCGFRPQSHMSECD